MRELGHLSSSASATTHSYAALGMGPRFLSPCLPVFSKENQNSNGNVLEPVGLMSHRKIEEASSPRTQELSGETKPEIVIRGPGVGVGRNRSSECSPHASHLVSHASSLLLRETKAEEPTSSGLLEEN